MDELPEFARATLESLRQPLETGRIVVARANNHLMYPARIQLVAAMNPCRCGYFGDLERQCHRAPRCAEDYQSKISGPLMDRFDLVFHVNEVKVADLLEKGEGEASASIAKRVAVARALQMKRYGQEGELLPLNSVLDGEKLHEIAGPDSDGQDLLTKAIEKLRLSARSYHRVLRVARTIADLESSETVKRPHIAEALSYRQGGMGIKSAPHS